MPIKTFMVDDETANLIANTAKLSGVSQSDLIRESISLYVNRELKKRLYAVADRVAKVFADEPEMKNDLLPATLDKLLDDHREKLETADDALLRGFVLVAYEMVKRNESGNHD